MSISICNGVSWLIRETMPLPRIAARRTTRRAARRTTRRAARRTARRTARRRTGWRTRWRTRRAGARIGSQGMAGGSRRTGTRIDRIRMARRSIRATGSLSTTMRSTRIIIWPGVPSRGMVLS
jgi:hypothetical protein